jgi:hypothetical protein
MSEINKEIPTVEVCKTSDSCFMDSLENDQFSTESLSERVVGQLEAINFSASMWSLTGKNVSIFIEQNRRDYELHNTQSEVSRNDRRISDRNRESFLTQRVSSAHNIAVSQIGTGILEKVFTDNLLEAAPTVEELSGLEEKLLDIHNKKMNTMGQDRSFAVQDELVITYQFEFIARAYMQAMNQEAPEVLQAIFDPSSIMDLPFDLQRIASLDINRGVGASVLLNNAAKVTTGEQPKSVELAEYIQANNLPENVKKSLLAIKLGMSAMGAPTCPFNDLGICTHLLSKVPDNHYPEEIQRDITNRDNTAIQRRIASLVAFAKRNPVSKILDSSILLNESFASNSTQSKKRTTAPKLEKRDFAAVENLEIDTPAFTKVKFRLANSDAIFEATGNLVDTIEKTIDDVFEQKIVKKYSETYHDEKLNDMLLHALTVIALMPTYIGTDRMVTPWLEMKNKAHINEEGVKERFMRYSGSRAVGISGGPIGKDTRVIFSQGTENGVRHITIHRIIHKSDVKSSVISR